jgi:L-alanine-DL-glutamate epimerase-like enolase superfamily enzyme
MRPARLTFASLPIPFRTRFAHAAATRAHAENILVLARDSEGRIGLGEGCPRTYVTGESVATALEFMRRHAAEFEDALDSPERLAAWTDGNREEIDANPSAFCAAELALLDLFAQQRAQSLEGLLGLPREDTAIVTSAIYGSGGAAKFLIQAALFAANGMRDTKLKLTGRPKHDGARAALLSFIGRVRLDANNLWPDCESALCGLHFAARHAWAIEEPLRARDWAGMARLSQRTGLSIIADESVTRCADLDALPRETQIVLNLRVSKLGGLRRTLAMLDRAAAQNLPVIVGAHVGETSILARAGLVAAKAAGKALIAYEGCYGTHLLEWDTTRPSLRFGWQGKIAFRENGLGPLGAGLSSVPRLLEAHGKESNAWSRVPCQKKFVKPR